MTIPQQANNTGPTLFSAKMLPLSQTINAETPITSEIWQTFMEQLNKVNQNNKLFEKGI